MATYDYAPSPYICTPGVHCHPERLERLNSSSSGGYIPGAGRQSHQASVDLERYEQHFAWCIRTLSALNPCTFKNRHRHPEMEQAVAAFMRGDSNALTTG